MLIFSLLAVWGGLAAQAASSRVVAVGDVHADFSSLVAILQRTGIVDREYRWIGGDTTLVQTGDFLDRGPSGREVMDLLMELEKSAPRSGGRVVVLLGNHEVMNLTGDLRYVPPELYSSFADGKSERRRQDAYRDYQKLLERNARTGSQADSAAGTVSKTDWLEQHPPGFLEYQKAIAPRGKYGRWLRKHSPLVQIDETVFLHGGIHPALATSGVKELNDRLNGEIKAFDEYRDYLEKKKLIEPFFTLDEILSAVQNELAAVAGEGTSPSAAHLHHQILDRIRNIGNLLIMHPDGPLWFRGFASWTEEEGVQRMPLLLQKFGAKRFVVGHTPQLEGIRVRFGGGVVLIDTGMLSGHYRGRASALEIKGDRLTAFYLNQRETLEEASELLQPAVE